MRLGPAMAALAIAVAACSNSAQAQQSGTLCDSFVKNADGSWSATRAVAYPAAGRVYNIREGAQFRPGAAFAGMDVAAELEKECPAAVQAQVEVAKQVDVVKLADANGNIDVQKFTCEQLAGIYQNDADFLAIWYSGWSNGSAKRQTMNVAKVREAARNIVAYCKVNKDKRLVQAMDAILKDERGKR